MGNRQHEINKADSSAFSEKTISQNSIVKRLSVVGIFGNIVLAAFKFIAGAIGNSSALISDGIHSLSDTLATFIALIGVRISKRQADAEHPYGHERFECAASMVLGVILIFTAIGIGYWGVEQIATGSYVSNPIPGVIAIIAAVVSIVIKEAMFWYTRHYAIVLKSSAFMADAWHHRSDALSSIAAVIGVGGAMLGVPVMDPLASVVICFFILKVAIDIERDAFNNMMDTSGGAELDNALISFIASQPGVGRVDMLQSRKFGNMIYVDAEIAVDGDIQLREAHAIAENVHDEVEGTFEDVKHIMIHVNPLDVSQ